MSVTSVAAENTDIGGTVFMNDEGWLWRAFMCVFI